MDTRNGLVTFTLFVFIFVFAFVFSVDALGQSNTLYGILALLGFVVCLIGSLFNGIMANKGGEALGVWFMTYAVFVGIITVWYLTRCGTAFGWW